MPRKAARTTRGECGSSRGGMEASVAQTFVERSGTTQLKPDRCTCSRSGKSLGMTILLDSKRRAKKWCHLARSNLRAGAQRGIFARRLNKSKRRRPPLSRRPRPYPDHRDIDAGNADAADLEDQRLTRDIELHALEHAGAFRAATEGEHRQARALLNGVDPSLLRQDDLVAARRDSFQRDEAAIAAVAITLGRHRIDHVAG